MLHLELHGGKLDLAWALLSQFSGLNRCGSGLSCFKRCALRGSDPPREVSRAQGLTVTTPTRHVQGMSAHEDERRWATIGNAADQVIPLPRKEAAMDSCPACTASMRDGDLHCGNQDCIWFKCGKCKAVIDVEYGTYWTANVWGNAEGYIKADDGR